MTASNLEKSPIRTVIIDLDEILPNRRGFLKGFLRWQKEGMLGPASVTLVLSDHGS